MSTTGQTTGTANWTSGLSPEQAVVSALVREQAGTLDVPLGPLLARADPVDLTTLLLRARVFPPLAARLLDAPGADPPAWLADRAEQARTVARHRGLLPAGPAPTGHRRAGRARHPRRAAEGDDDGRVAVRRPRGARVGRPRPARGARAARRGRDGADLPGLGGEPPGRARSGACPCCTGSSSIPTSHRSRCTGAFTGTRNPSPAEALRRASLTEHGWLRLAPPDELATLLLFLARDGLAGLRQVVDVAAWWRALGRPQTTGLEHAPAGRPASGAGTQPHRGRQMGRVVGGARARLPDGPARPAHRAPAAGPAAGQPVAGGRAGSRWTRRCR